MICSYKKTISPLLFSIIALISITAIIDLHAVVLQPVPLERIPSAQENYRRTLVSLLDTTYRLCTVLVEREAERNGTEAAIKIAQDCDMHIKSIIEAINTIDQIK